MLISYLASSYAIIPMNVNPRWLATYLPVRTWLPQPLYPEY